MLRPAAAHRALHGLLLPVCLAGCAGWRPVPEPVAAALSGPRIPAALRDEGRLRVESPWFSGTFEAVVVVRRDPLAIRTQWFPELGGKVLDLIVRPDRIEGSMPQADHEGHFDLTRTHDHDPLLLVGLTLLEEYRPLDPAGVDGARRRGPGWELRRAGTPPGASVVVRIDAAGRVLARRFGYRGAGWRVVAEAPDRARLEAPEVAITWHRRRRTTLDTVPGGVFPRDGGRR